MKKRNRHQGEQVNINYQPGDLLSFAEAVALLAKRDSRTSDDQLAAKERWRKRIKDHTLNGKLPSENGKYQIERLVTWAMNLKVKGNPGWSSQLADLPAMPNTLCITLPALEMRAYGYSLPQTLEDSHKEIARLSAEFHKMNEEIEALKAEVAALRPDAKKYRETCEKNRRNAQRKSSPALEELRRK